jgi:hypothetical protein
LDLSFDTILMELEERTFGRELEKVLDETRRTFAKQSRSLSEGPLRDSLADVDLYLTVARRLLAGETKQLWEGGSCRRSDLASVLGNDAAADKLVRAVADLQMNVDL